MASKTLRPLRLFLLLAGLAATGCAQADDPAGTGGGSPDASTPNDASVVTEGGTDGTTPLDTGLAEGSGDGAWCGGEVQEAQLVPLDLYIMLDGSGSMTREVSGTYTKWDAVKQAMQDFTSDASMDRLELALQIFPFMQPGVPKTCGSTPDCNGFGPCVQPKICDNHYFGGNVVPCTTPDDCVSGQDAGNCLPQGTCTGEQNLVCLPEFEAVCKNNLGECVATPAECAARQSCDPGDYANPLVAMAPRPDAAGPILDALDAREPDGATPMGPALQGAVSYLQTWLVSHPQDRTAVVLVTDGLPTDCTPVDVDAIASVASAAAPDVLTYVIGVFEDEQAQNAQQNLDAIASAGGTDSALIIKTSQDVASELIGTLATIREHSLACEYAIPEPTEGALEYDLVNVEYEPGDGTSETIPYVETQGACAAAGGGWYYDDPPEQGGEPTQIRLCPETCSAIQGNPEGAVSIRLGCPTVVVK